MTYKLCSTRKACELLNIHSKTLMNWYHKGLIGGIKIEGKKNKHRYLIDLAGYFVRNNIDPALYLTPIPEGNNARQKRGTSADICAKTTADKSSCG